tara:strand:+ start:167 stop:1195 length:1029 start_codon:yes stop_codon:yes gene_type:complete
MKKVCLITGINGQDGCYLAKIAIENGYEVVGVQRKQLHTKSEQIVNGLRELGVYEKINFELTELEKLENVEELVKKYKPIFLIHLASQSSIEKSFNHKDLTYKSNTLISKNIIDSVEKYSKDTKVFFPSSATIFEGYNNIVAHEETKPKPLSNYSISKFNTQKYIDEKVSESNLILKTGIMFSHESEYRRDNFFSKKIIKFLIEYKNGSKKSLSVGDISIKRDIGYAPEYTDAIFKILLLENSEKYIVSSNTLYKLSNFIEFSLDYLQLSYEVLFEDKLIKYIDISTGKTFIESDAKQFRKHDLRGIQGDNSKLITATGWKPKVKLEEICKKMIDYNLKAKL